MAESSTVTGNRDDLLLDASRCLKMRFCESRCCRCVDICPHGAVTLDNGLALLADQCQGCLLCAAVCPVGALEQQNDFTAIIMQLAKVPEPILGCLRTNDCAHASLPCLGGLSAEHLLTLCHSLSGKLTLNVSLCRDCPNSAIIAELEQRLAAISTAGLCADGSRIVLAESAAEIHFRAETVDRRSFFTSIGTALARNAAVILANTAEKKAEPAQYGVKRAPARRILLNKIRAKLSPEPAALLEMHFDAAVSFNENCTRCYGCVAICPTGALRAVVFEEPPAFDPLLCTGCRLCSDFCLESAVRMTSLNNQIS